MKDARWELATTVVTRVGLDSINEMPYDNAQKLLDGCQAVLDGLSEHEIQVLADEWNARE